MAAPPPGGKIEGQVKREVNYRFGRHFKKGTWEGTKKNRDKTAGNPEKLTSKWSEKKGKPMQETMAESAFH